MDKCQPYLNINNGQEKYIINYKNKEISLIVIELYYKFLSKVDIVEFIQPTMLKEKQIFQRGETQLQCVQITLSAVLTLC